MNIDAADAQTGEIIELNPMGLSLPGSVLPTGLMLPDGLPFDDWQRVGELLKSVERSVLWWVGDWLNYGERCYGETYSQALEATDYSYQSIRDAKWVAGKFELSRRRDKLSWSHHREVAALEPPAADELLTDAEREGWTRDELRKRIKGHVRGTFGTGENEWYTPAEYMEHVRAVLGHIDLDPASNEIANRTVQAGKYFTRSDNGLEQEWLGTVWLNPPYSQPDISLFADKLVAECESGRVDGAIALTHNYTDTTWFHKIAVSATAMCFTRGRVRFVSEAGELASPTQGQVFFYFGPDSHIFADVFSKIGFVAHG